MSHAGIARSIRQRARRAGLFAMRRWIGPLARLVGASRIILRNAGGVLAVLRLLAGIFGARSSSQAYELWAKTYPQDLVPPTNLGDIYAQLGQYEKAVTETQDGLRLEPTMVGYGNLAGDYLALNRLDDVNKTIEQALGNFEGDTLHRGIDQSAFLKGNAAEMERQLAWAAGKPGSEDILLSFQSDTEAYYGRLVKARDFSRRAVDAAVRNDSRETAALWQVNAALRSEERR